MRTIALVVAMVALTPQPSAAAQHPVLALLDDYAAGRHDEVRAALSDFENVDDARQVLEKGGNAWVTAAGAGDAPARRLTLAVFVLELAEAVKYNDWPSTMRLLEWTSDLIGDGRPSDAERLWHRAAIAIHQGMRWAEVATIKTARDRFPDDQRLAFTEVQSQAAVLVRGWRQRDNESRRASPMSLAHEERILKRLTEFRGDPDVGGEAAVWAGLMTLLNRRDPDGAMQYFAEASEARDPFAVYLAHYAAGRVQESAGRLAEAEAQYRRALSVIPRSQSATMSLSALLFVEGDPDAAYALMNDAYASPPPPDPFQLYGFGDYWRLPGYMDQLREAVRR